MLVTARGDLLLHRVGTVSRRQATCCVTPSNLTRPFFFYELDEACAGRTQTYSGWPSADSSRINYEVTANNHRLFIPQGTPLHKLASPGTPEFWLSGHLLWA